MYSASSLVGIKLKFSPLIACRRWRQLSTYRKERASLLLFGAPCTIERISRGEQKCLTEIVCNYKVTR